MASYLNKYELMINKWFKKRNMENKDVLQDETLLQDEVTEQTENTVTTEHSKEIEDLKAQVSELKSKMLYQQAEFDNFRKRTMKEKTDIILTASRDTMTALLPVLDDFGRASKNEEFTEGVNLVWSKLQNIVKSKGLTEMDTPAGTEFNPDQHEAITEIPAGDDLVGKVVDTVEMGYLLNEKIIRHAKVVVGK
jgi:molecular chaperone GrpE